MSTTPFETAGAAFIPQPQMTMTTGINRQGNCLLTIDFTPVFWLLLQFACHPLKRDGRLVKVTRLYRITFARRARMQKK